MQRSVKRFQGSFAISVVDSILRMTREKEPVTQRNSDKAFIFFHQNEELGARVTAKFMKVLMININEF